MVIPDVSVVIPTRNRKELFARALGTVLGQRDVEVEVIVVDDGSSDGTAEIVRALDDRRVTLLRHETPKGVSEARNAGIARARAPWVAFLDDDDFWAPTKLAQQIEAARGGASWVCVDAVVVDVGLSVLGCWRLPAERDLVQLLSYNCVPGGGSGPMARTELVRELGGFDPKLAILADWEMWIRLFLRGMPASVNRPLVGYLRHNGSMSHVDEGFAAEIEWIVDKHASARRARGVEVHRYRWQLWAAAGRLRAGNRRGALKIYLELIRRHHDVKSILRAAMAAAVPGLLLCVWSLNLRRRAPLESLAYAETWLAPLRAGQCLATDQTRAAA
jgi:glycosyltransferase involved in cell wall biosynthesis